MQHGKNGNGPNLADSPHRQLEIKVEQTCRTKQNVIQIRQIKTEEQYGDMAYFTDITFSVKFPDR